MKLGLERRVALVTGGSAGVGLGIAKALAAEGVRLVIAGRREDALSRACAEIGDARSVSIDLSQVGAAEKLARAAEDVDILVNCAGASAPLGIGGSEADWAVSAQLRMIGGRQLIEALLPHMRANRFGRIISIGGGFEVQQTINAASVFNAAITVYGKSLSHMVAADGVTVNTIALGFIRSEQMDRAPVPVPESAIPVGSYGEPSDVGALVAFLASPVARYITGETISVDGGLRRFAF
ncbi:SDR family oxidoreductase [uncultured Parasphingorhabdus sp.]|uniref:SDR family oxidoreductase n=1 Tax=uncultured Parasphingorhabdus sp. TaxID=2709694 RepID=UPI0030DD6ADB|tara:strand:- start:1095 stop:1808 length:714 start_codon:yes stop_codon:yes gene_type:complete